MNFFHKIIQVTQDSMHVLSVIVSQSFVALWCRRHIWQTTRENKRTKEQGKQWK